MLRNSSVITGDGFKLLSLIFSFFFFLFDKADLDGEIYVYYKITRSQPTEKKMHDAISRCVSLKVGKRKPVSANLLLSCYVGSGR